MDPNIINSKTLKDNNINELTEKLLIERNEIVNEIFKIAKKNKNGAKYVDKINKKREINKSKFRYKREYYINKIFNDLDYSIINSDNCKINEYNLNLINNLKIEIEFVESIKQKDIWNFFRKNTSSFRSNKYPGKIIRMLIKDKTSKKYLGILELHSDLKAMKDRDEYIGWNRTNKFDEKKINHIMNISCCVGLQPISYNLLVGKLLVGICFSKEVQDYMFKKYGHYIAGYTTLGLYGKSSQYDRSKYINFIGYTKGAVPNLPDTLYDRMKKFGEDCGLDFSKKNNSGIGDGRRKNIKKILQLLGLKYDILDHNIKRGIYFGYTGKKCKDFLVGKANSYEIDVITLEEIVNYWKNRWAMPRYTRLTTKKFDNDKTKKNDNLCLKTDLELYFDIFKKQEQNCQYVKAYNSRLKNALGEDVYKIIKNSYARDYYHNNKFKEHIKITTNNDLVINFDPKYLGGLFDGDGTISIYKEGESYYNLSITFPQSVFNILKLLQSMFGGSMYKRKQPDTDARRQQYSWKVNGLDCKKILDYLEKGCILKYEQVLLAKKFLPLINKSGKDIEKEKLCLRIHSLNQKIVKSKLIDFNKIDFIYICGLFDAEGCIRIGGSPNNYTGYSVSIAQLNNIDILYEIQKFFNCGTVSVKYGHWKASNRKIMEKYFIDMLDHVIIKKIQIECILKYFDEDPSLHMKEKQKIRGELAEILKNEKHTSIDINKNDIIGRNNNQKNIKKQYKIDAKEIKKQLNKDDARIKMSVAKLGIGNPNYGVDRLDEHSKNISKSVLLKDRKISDEDIDMIIEFHNNGETHEDIGAVFNISRQYVDNIVNGKVKKMSYIEENIDKIVEENWQKKKEIENKNKDMTDDELKLEKNRSTSKSKRKLTVKQMIKILMLKNKGISSTDINNHVDFKTKDGNNISDSIVKNVWSGKTQLYEEEFEGLDISYDEYLKIIKQKINQYTINRSKKLSQNNRTLTVDQMIEALFMMEKNIPYKNILKNLCDKYGENGGNNGKKITINVIKKLKTIKICEEEFDGKNMTFQKYLSIIS